MKHAEKLIHKLSAHCREKRIPTSNPKAVQLAVDYLESSGVIAIPTDTVYGLACNATDKEAVQRLYKIKGRCEYKPLAICLGHVNDLSKWAKISHLPRPLLNHLLPGPVTLVLQCTSTSLDDSLNPANGKIGIRIPNSVFIRSVTNLVEFPLALTSANVSGESSSLEVEEFQSLWPQLNAVFDSGTLGFDDAQRAASTVVDLTVNGFYKILRHGVSGNNTITVLQKYGLTKLAN